MEVKLFETKTSRLIALIEEKTKPVMHFYSAADIYQAIFRPIGLEPLSAMWLSLNDGSATCTPERLEH
jgi:hypothetical protein